MVLRDLKSNGRCFRCQKTSHTKLTKGYWIEVCNKIQTKYRVKPTVACKAIRDYRSNLIKSHIGDIMYHTPTQHMADDIFIGGYTDEN